MHILLLIASLSFGAADPNLLAQAAECYRDQDYIAAHYLAINYLKTAPNDLAGEFLYVAAANQLDKLDEAKNVFAKAATNGEKTAEGFLNLIKLLEGDRSTALALSQELLKNTPQCAPALFVVALQKDDQAKQLVNSEALTKAAPDFAGGYELFASLLQAAGKTDEACNAMKTAYGLPTHSSRTAGSLADLLYSAGKGDQAWDLCNQAILHGENDARIWSVAAAILYAQKKMPEATAMIFQACLRDKPDRHVNGIMDTLLVKAQPEHKHNDAMHQSIEEALHIYSAGKIDEALAKFEKLSKSDPDDATVWLLLGMSLSDLGRYEDALISLDKATVLAPYDPRCPLYSGEVLRKMKNYTKAYESFSQAMLLDPRDVRAHAGMASCALLAGSDGPETFHALVSLVLSPANPDAVSVLQMKRAYSSTTAAASRLLNGKTIIAYRLMDPEDTLIPRRYEIVVLDENDEWLRSYSWTILSTQQILEVRDGLSSEHRLIPLPDDVNIISVLNTVLADLSNVSANK